jgi:hypothetical protein
MREDTEYRVLSVVSLNITAACVGFRRSQSSESCVKCIEVEIDQRFLDQQPASLVFAMILVSTAMTISSGIQPQQDRIHQYLTSNAENLWQIVQSAVVANFNVSHASAGGLLERMPA